jgi:hypothetical protein
MTSVHVKYDALGVALGGVQYTYEETYPGIVSAVLHFPLDIHLGVCHTSSYWRFA